MPMKTAKSVRVLGVEKMPSSRCKRVNGGPSFDPIRYARSLVRNYSNFCKSQRPGRVLFFDHGYGEWQDFPQDLMVPLSDAFSAKTAIVEISMANCSYLFDFAQMVVTDMNTGAKRSVAWIDEGGSCFFPDIAFDDDSDKTMSSNSDEIELKLRIQIGGTDNSDPSDSEEEHEATSNARLVEINEAVVTENATSMMTRVRRFDPLGLKLVQLERQDEDYKIVDKMFLMGASVATPDNVLHIHRIVPEDGATQARWQKFEEHIKTMEELRGDANVRCAWHGTSKEGVVGILRNGFGIPSVGLEEMAYGPAVCLAPQHCSHISLNSCDVDEDDVQHMVLCRVIMGNMEQVQPGSEHFHPSSEDFDSGVDDFQNPRLYVICNSHMNTHIQAGYLVSFKLSPSQREHLAGLKNACSNVDVSMTSDQQANSTPNLIGGTSNSEPEEHEVISNARLVENKEAVAENATVIPSVLRFDGLADNLEPLNRKDEINKKSTTNLFNRF